jgi:predicted transcriptional regulator
MASNVTWGELAALAAIGRGATELRMMSRVQERLLTLGLIEQPGGQLSVTEAGRRVLKPYRTNRWL